MKLPYFSRRFVRRLRDNAASNVASYGIGGAWLQAFMADDVFIHDSNEVVDPPPQLQFDDSDNPRHDGENAIRVYRWLEKLSPAVAMEERLWACLAHDTFADYMAVRWPVESESTITRRYLLEGQSAAALARHGIARLWWGAYLTRDDNRADPFELTRVLFLRQDIQVSLLERSLGKCRRVRVAVLDFLRLDEGWLAGANTGRRIQLLLRDLNMQGGVSLLDALPADALAALVRERAAIIAENET